MLFLRTPSLLLQWFAETEMASQTLGVDLKLNYFPVCLLRGAGQEVGRSCHILEFKGKKVMVSVTGC